MKIAHGGAGETKNVGRSKGTGPWRESERERKKKEGEEGEREERGRETEKESHQESEELTKDEVLITETFAL